MKSRVLRPSNRSCGWITSPLHGKTKNRGQWAVTTLEFQRLQPCGDLHFFIEFMRESHASCVKVMRSIIQYGCRCNLVQPWNQGTKVFLLSRLFSCERAGCFCRLPTGTGKSLCYWGFARYFQSAKARGNSESIVVVVSPLRASNKL